MKLLIMYSNSPPTQGHIQRLADLDPGLEIEVARSEAEAIRHAPDSAVFLGHRYLWQALPHTRCLQWVQSTAGGLDHIVSDDLFRIRPMLSRNPIFAPVVARHAHTLAWAIIRRIPEAVQAQAVGLWKRPLPMLAAPSVAMVLGMGGIGREIGRLLRRDGMRVIGVARSGSDDAMAACDELITTGAWRNRLTEVDLCILALPLTCDTRLLFDEAALQALPEHAVVINVGRGATLDDAALCRRLEAGRLGGAALDVVEDVPPPGDRLWRTPGLLLTPKAASYHPEMQRDLEAYIESQVVRYLSGETPLHTVDLGWLAQSLDTA